jgi:hypothetical protein
MSLQRRIELFLFAVAFLAFGWFNQGGGWNQNARFAEVRAIVDGHRIAIDDYLCYERRGGKMLRRYPIIDGDVTIGTKTTRLSWVGVNGDLIPINGVEAPVDMDEAALDDLCSSGDVAYAQGQFHPNKPPGLTLVALPAYFVLSHFERLMHRNPDSWWLLNVNAWLTSLFSVGILSAVGVVLAFRLAQRFLPNHLWSAFWTAIAFGFGTIFFPFGTVLFDHNVTAVFLLGAFYVLFLKEGPRYLALAGLLAGLASISNYIAAVPAGMFGIYLLVTRVPRDGWARSIQGLFYYGAGLLGPLLLICAYNQHCFGSPFALSTHFQNPNFVEHKWPVLGMFNFPDPAVMLILLISPFRGIFYSAPILLMGVYGLWRMRKTFAPEVALILGVALTFFVVNASFFGWHAGFACGPRYLIPATCFLALPCVYGFARLPRISGLLLAASCAINFLFAATDAECPAGVGSLAMTGDREMFWYSPLTEYSAPLFFEGRAWPILNLMMAERVQQYAQQMSLAGLAPEDQQKLLAKFANDMHAAIVAGNDDPLELGSYTGPVSVNPTGVCEGGYYSLFSPGSPQARWNSFNVGEFWFPESRWSVVPLLALVGLLGLGLAFEAARAGASGAGLPAFGELAPEEVPVE